MTERLSLLRALEERLAKAAGADRELDAEIAECLMAAPDGYTRFIMLQGQPGEQTVGFFDFSTNPPRQKWNAPQYTTSLDAALALKNAALPDMDWRAERVCGIYRAAVADFVQGVRLPRILLSEAPTAPLALCLAIIRALIAKEEARRELENAND